MKRFVIGTFLVAFGALSFMNVNTAPEIKSLNFQKSAAITLGYDKSMSEKTIKAAVIDAGYEYEGVK